MFKKQWVQQILIGLLIWVVGSAIWSLISTGLHIPPLNWSSIGYLAEFVFGVYLFAVAVPFATQSLNLYFAKKNLEVQREQLELEERKAALQPPAAKESPVVTPAK